MPRKSRGCQSCRLARKKCDDFQPSCQFCSRNNLVCLGRSVGPIIINQTKSVVLRYECDRKLSLLDQSPSSRATTSAAFASLFFSFVTTASASSAIPSWLTRFEYLPSTFRHDTALDLALQATATVYCGVHANNQTIIREACAIYSQALSMHSKSIARSKQPPIVALICTSIVLSLFEAIWPSTLDGYAMHLTAARNLTGLTLNFSKKDGAHNDLLRQIYVHTLYQSIFTAFTCPFECISLDELATKSHSVIVISSDKSQPLADRLMTQLFKLGKIVCFLTSGSRDDFSFQLGVIDTQLECLRDEHLRQTANQKKRLYWATRNKSDIDVDGSFLLPAYFASSAILLSIARSKTCTCNMEVAEVHHQTILDSSFQLVKSLGANSSAYLPMYLPIALVALHSTSQERRASACELLQLHQKETIFKGISQRIGVWIAQGGSIIHSLPVVPAV
ncbi:hypothetical protein DM02DRAFT_671777 [Periconia macrospinosa]|uniref:Zn(2)-C6 fungal-type domain-containing protein n=1 Tax=Periconia macrospinosa TaxID=97972 RepID=A0A2V1DU69_9PLEO|nr:hypothetical protein DM02DRAFT_671777 [Periconia macrospinosa]